MKAPICDYCEKPRPSARPQKDFHVRDPDFGDRVRPGVLCNECANKIRVQFKSESALDRMSEIIKGEHDATV